MAATSIRWEVTKHLIDLLRADAISDVGLMIEPGWVNEMEHRAEMIFVSEMESTVAIPTMGGSRMQRDEDITLTFQCWVRKKPTFDATATRLVELTAYIEDRIASDTTLGDFDGVTSCEITDLRSFTGGTPDGLFGTAEVKVAIYTRLI